MKNKYWEKVKYNAKLLTKTVTQVWFNAYLNTKEVMYKFFFTNPDSRGTAIRRAESIIRQDRELFEAEKYLKNNDEKEVM